MMAVQDATRTIAAEQLVFSGPLLLACLAVAAATRPRFTAVIVRGAQFRLDHAMRSDHWSLARRNPATGARYLVTFGESWCILVPKHLGVYAI
ncbi:MULTISPECIES: hypothetical protein [Mesorhizobium]|uniref:hypothetical protein n=1 Tax=Mesorhizobium TaxID=68287 RepID=UPI0003CE3805|nr:MULTISPECIES: hypothetical protein [Mesorhizobium]ESY65971.1 hypothetical protein X742_20725 [Mesorhizobium sp. LNHC232B00]WJI38280.1 hypothetical protein NL534_31225 [Mesorhizobium opportunistum]